MQILHTGHGESLKSRISALVGIIIEWQEEYLKLVLLNAPYTNKI